MPLRPGAVGLALVSAPGVHLSSPIRPLMQRGILYAATMTALLYSTLHKPMMRRKTRSRVRSAFVVVCSVHARRPLTLWWWSVRVGDVFAQSPTSGAIQRALVVSGWMDREFLAARLPHDLRELAVCAHQYLTPMPTTWSSRTTAISVPEQSGILHSKFMLVEFSNTMRVAVGSGNMFEAWSQTRDLWWLQDFPKKSSTARRGTQASTKRPRNFFAKRSPATVVAPTDGGCSDAGDAMDPNVEAGRARGLVSLPDFEAYLTKFLRHQVREVSGKGTRTPEQQDVLDKLRPYIQALPHFDFSGANATLVGSWRGSGATIKRGTIHAHGHMRLRWVVQQLTAKAPWAGHEKSPVLTLAASQGNMQPEFLYVRGWGKRSVAFAQLAV